MTHINVYGAFLDGMRKGWNVGVTQLLPNIMLAFVSIRILQISGILDTLGNLCGGIMGLFGLPGASLVVLLTTLLSAGGGVGAAVGLYTEGILTTEHLSILTPAIFLMGAQIQYLGRILGVAGVAPKHYPVLCIIGIVNGIIGMLIMRLIVGN